MLSLVEIGSVVLEKKIFLFRKCIFAISSYRRRTTGDQKSSLELSAQVIFNTIKSIGKVFFWSTTIRQYPENLNKE